MKLVAVSRVRNEADIIEPFVRHHTRYFDRLVILDDGSTDGTYEMLRSLQAEGFPLELSRKPAVGYEQSLYMTRLLRCAVDRFEADWVAPLDADEFIEPPDGKSLADLLAGQEPALLSMSWSNFAWSPEDDDAEPNPVIRQRFRVPHSEAILSKVLAPAHLINTQTELSQGSHALMLNGGSVAACPLSAVRLCHFPIRSLEQYASKVVIGFLQYTAMPNWDGVQGFHYLKPFQTLLNGGLDALKDRMRTDSLYYSVAGETLQERTLELEDAPLRYKGGALMLPIVRPPFVQNIVNYAQAMARDRADWARGGEPDATTLGAAS